jgi:hypothetical protein
VPRELLDEIRDLGLIVMLRQPTAQVVRMTLGRAGAVQVRADILRP